MILSAIIHFLKKIASAVIRGVAWLLTALSLWLPLLYSLIFFVVLGFSSATFTQVKTAYFCGLVVSFVISFVISSYIYERRKQNREGGGRTIDAPPPTEKEFKAQLRKRKEGAPVAAEDGGLYGINTMNGGNDNDANSANAANMASGAFGGYGAATSQYGGYPAAVSGNYMPGDMHSGGLNQSGNQYGSPYNNQYANQAYNNQYGNQFNQYGNQYPQGAAAQKNPAFDIQGYIKEQFDSLRNQPTDGKNARKEELKRELFGTRGMENGGTAGAANGFGTDGHGADSRSEGGQFGNNSADGGDFDSGGRSMRGFSLGAGEQTYGDSNYRGSNRRNADETIASFSDYKSFSNPNGLHGAGSAGLSGSMGLAGSAGDMRAAAGQNNGDMRTLSKDSVNEGDTGREIDDESAEPYREFATRADPTVIIREYADRVEYYKRTRQGLIFMRSRSK